MKAALRIQPLVVGVAANNKYIHSYASGVIDAEDCAYAVMYHDEKLNTINHGVLAVGYGHDKITGLDYILVRNSWNTTWGENGYFKLSTAFDVNNSVCGWNMYSMYYPVLD